MINEKATLEGWTWKVDRSFKLDNIISGQTIEMGEKYYNEASKYVEGKVLLRNHKFSNDKKLDYVKNGMIECFYIYIIKIIRLR